MNWSFRYRLVACVAVGLTCQAAFAPLAAASMVATAGADKAPPAGSAVPPAGRNPDQGRSRRPPGRRPSRAPRARTTRSRSCGRRAGRRSSIPSPPRGAESLFDGDATTGFTSEAGKSGAVRLELGVGARGGRPRRSRQRPGEDRDLRGGPSWRAQADQDGPRRRDQAGGLSLGAGRPDGRRRRRRRWWCSGRRRRPAPATVTELALWVRGRSRAGPGRGGDRRSAGDRAAGERGRGDGDAVRRRRWRA